MTRKRLVISVNDGRAKGSGAQHCSISNLHSESQKLGTGGLRVLLTMPPAKERVHSTTAKRRVNNKAIPVSIKSCVTHLSANNNL
jgi:hypothetical protein